MLHQSIIINYQVGLDSELIFIFSLEKHIWSASEFPRGETGKFLGKNFMNQIYTIIMRLR